MAAAAIAARLALPRTARRDSAPVCGLAFNELGGPLIALARELDDDRVASETFLELAPRLRLIAATPQPCASPSPDALRALLGQARDAHGLTLVDCGTHWTAGDPVLAEATHIIWTVAATPTGLARARAHLTAGVAPPEGRWREMLAATAILPRPLVPVRAL